MEFVTVRKSSLENVLKDLSRASLICSDVSGWIAEVNDAMGDHADNKLYCSVRVLELLMESLDTTHDNLDYWVENADKHVAQPAPAPRPAFTLRKPVVLPDVDYSDFDDISDEDLLAECRQQEGIAAAADLEGAIAAEALLRRIKAAA